MKLPTKKLMRLAICALSSALIAQASVGCGGNDYVSDDGGMDEQGNPLDTGIPLDGTVADGSLDTSMMGDTTLTDTTTDTTMTDGSADAGDGSVTCSAVGVSCTTSATCCSVNCDIVSGKCVAPVISCGAPNDVCTVPGDCCSRVCSLGTCGAKLCTSDNQACTTDAQCCGGVCGITTDGAPRTCTPLSPTCSSLGNTCALSANCCSHFCNAGVCSSPSFCGQTGDSCTSFTDCCGGLCTKAADAGVATLGVCTIPAAPGATQCTVAGEVCGAGADAGPSDGGVPACGGNCCSRACAPFAATGVDICQPPDGCHPRGELCVTDNDCCGSLNNPGGSNGNAVCSRGNPSDPLGRCTKPNCAPNGDICRLQTGSCNARADCCSGNALTSNPPTCNQDALGIPRCSFGSVTPGCVDGGAPRTGLACSTSLDCCGLPCVPTGLPTGPALVCGATACVPVAGLCTSNADCCTGSPCVLPTGSTVGMCKAPPGTSPDGGIIDAGTLPDGAPVDAGTPPPGCSLYGQTCTVSGNCCNGVPCIAGSCHFPL
jgi:hypothetical protein